MITGKDFKDAVHCRRATRAQEYGAQCMNRKDQILNDLAQEVNKIIHNLDDVLLEKTKKDTTIWFATAKGPLCCPIKLMDFQHFSELLHEEAVVQGYHEIIVRHASVQELLKILRDRGFQMGFQIDTSGTSRSLYYVLDMVIVVTEEYLHFQNWGESYRIVKYDAAGNALFKR